MDNRPQKFRILWRPDEARVYLFGVDKEPQIIPESNIKSMAPADSAMEEFEKWFGGPPGEGPEVEADSEGNLTEKPAGKKGWPRK